MPENEKILIAEISDNTTWYDFFPWANHVWVVATTNVYTNLIDPAIEAEEIGLNNSLPVLSFQVRKEEYINVSSTTLVQATEKTWYFDKDNHWLYIHFEDDKPYTYFGTEEIEIGFTLGFYYTNSHATGRWNNVQYEKRLLKPPAFVDAKDDLYHAKQVFKSTKIQIENGDLKYINFSIGTGVNNKTGNLVRFLEWSGVDASAATYAQFNVIFQGAIEKITEGVTLGIVIRDIRSTLQTASPVSLLDTDNFTDIKNPTKDYIKPQLWGTCKRVPCICLNENEAQPIAANYMFMLCDIENHHVSASAVTTIYIDGIETGIAPGTVTMDTVNNIATFVISPDNFATSEDGGAVNIRYDGMNSVSVDTTGYLKGVDFRESDGSKTSSSTDLIENAMAIIRQIIKNNYGWDYTTDEIYYDLTTWQSFEDDTTVTYDIGYYLKKPISTQKQIQEIAMSLLGKFIINENRKFSWDNDDFVSYETDIPKEKILGANWFPSVNQDSTEVLSKFRVGYEKRYKENDSEKLYNWVTDSSNQSTALTTYNSTFQRDFPTLLTDAAQVALYAARVLDFGGSSNDRIKIEIPWLDGKDLKAGEWLRVQLDHSSTEIYGWTKCQIQKVTPKHAAWTVNLDLRMFEFIPVLTFDSIAASLDSVFWTVEE